MNTPITLFENRTLQKYFLQEGIKEVLKKRKTPLRLDNEKDGQVFFSDVQEYIINHYSRNLYTNYPDIIAAFKRYGVNNGTELILEMFEKRDKLAKQGYDMSKIKDPMELIKKYNIESHHSYIGMDTTRTLVVRSKYGTTEPLFYDWAGPIRDCPRLWAIKMDYHYKTGCNYYDARPILYSTWIELPREKQLASCVTDTTDF